MKTDISRHQAGRVLVLAGGVLLWLAAASPGAVPASAEFNVPQGVVNYQATLQTAAGVNYTNGLYDAEFRLYNAGTGGTLLWGASYKVYVKDGAFGVMLGQSGATNFAGASYGATELWKALWYDEGGANQNARYLSLKVLQDENNNPLASPSETVPRQQFLVAPFAARAEQAMYARKAIGDFDVAQQLTATNLLVYGTATLYQNVTLSSNLTVAGTATFQKAATCQNTLTVASTATFNQNVTMQKPLTLNDTASLTKAVTCGAGLTVAGTATFNGAVAVNQPSTFAASPTMNADITMNNRSMVASAGQNVSVANDDFTAKLRVNDNQTFQLMGNNGGAQVYNDTSQNLMLDASASEVRMTASKVKMNSFMPFVIQSFLKNMTGQGTTIWTGTLTNQWTAMVVGYDFGTGDVREAGTHSLWEVLAYPSGGEWCIRVESPTSDYPEIRVHVLFIRREFADDQRTHWGTDDAD